MTSWFQRSFDVVANVARDMISSGRHEILGGWYGRNFEPNPAQRQDVEKAQPIPGERDIHGNEHSIER